MLDTGLRRDDVSFLLHRAEAHNSLRIEFDADDLVVDLRIQHVRHEACADVMDDYACQPFRAGLYMPVKDMLVKIKSFLLVLLVLKVSSAEPLITPLKEYFHAPD